MAEAQRVTKGDIDRLELDFRADPTKFVPLARAYIERNLPLQAVQVCKDGIKRNPQVPEGELALAMAYYHIYDDNRAEVHLKKVLAGSPENHVAHRTLGEIYLERNQEGKAVEELNRALQIEPGDRHTRALLESLDEKLPALKTSNGQPTYDWLPRLHQAPKTSSRSLWGAVVQVSVMALLVIVFLIWYRGHVGVVTQIRSNIKEATKLIPRDNYDDLVQAQKFLKQALALDDSETRTIVGLTQVRANLFESHDQTEYLDDLKGQLAFFEQEDLQISERYSLQGLLLVHEGKAQQAVKLLSDIIDRAIEKKDILLNAMIFGVRASAHLAMGDMKQAREDYHRAAKFSGLNPHYQARFADVYLREGNLSRAIHGYQTALRRNPDHIASKLGVALARLYSGRNTEESKLILDELFDPEKHSQEEFSPLQWSKLHFVRAEYAMQHGDEAQARQWVDKALAIWDKNANAYSLLGQLLARANDGPGALAAFDKALQLDPRLPKIYFDRADSMFLLQPNEEAVNRLSDFEKALKPSVAYYVKRGTLLLKMDRLDAAQAEFEKAIALDELNPRGRYWKAMVYKTMADKLQTKPANQEKRNELYNLSRESFENAVMLPGGETADVYRQMGLIYTQSENYENALDKFAKAVMMMTKAGEPSVKIAQIYSDIATVFKGLGGPEGKKQAQAYLRKAKGLQEGKSVDQVEQEELLREKSRKKPRRRK